MKKRHAGLLFAAFASVSFALAANANLKLTINGTSTTPAIVVGGQTYIPLSALRNAGVGVSTSPGAVALTLGSAAASGGANQMTALEGCIGQTLFNGVWRMKVTGVTQGEANGSQGWLVGVEMRNGTQRPQYVYGTGLSNTNEAYTLVTADGNTGIWETFYVLNDFSDRNVPQAGMFTYTFKFFPKDKDQVAPPTKFLMRINTQYVNKKDAPYSVPDPSFRIDLTCKK